MTKKDIIEFTFSDSKEEKINKLGGETFPKISWSVLFTGSVFFKARMR